LFSHNKTKDMHLFEMKNIYTVFLFLIAFGFANEALALMPGYWERESTNGTQFIDGPAPTMKLRDGTSFAMPRTWYFYQDHIIGVVDRRGQEKIYLIIDELNSEVSTFEEDAWHAFIHTHRLQPLLWTRWYKGDWNKMTTLVYLMIFGFPITIGWLILHVHWIIKARKTGARKYLVYLSILPLLLLTTYLFSQFPGSV